jgi:hypothetical protein
VFFDSVNIFPGRGVLAVGRCASAQKRRFTTEAQRRRDIGAAPDIGAILEHIFSREAQKELQTATRNCAVCAAISASLCLCGESSFLL